MGFLIVSLPAPLVAFDFLSLPPPPGVISLIPHIWLGNNDLATYLESIEDRGMPLPDWKTKDKALIKEMLHHGEARLQGQMQLATSADQRATALAGIYVAVATAAFGAIATSDNIRSDHALLFGAVAVGLAFLTAAILCIWATLPVDFRAPGNDPESWYRDIEDRRDELEAMGEQAQHFNSAIHANRRVIKRNSEFFQFGALLGISAPIIGIVVVSVLHIFQAG